MSGRACGGGRVGGYDRQCVVGGHGPARAIGCCVNLFIDWFVRRPKLARQENEREEKVSVALFCSARVDSGGERKERGKVNVALFFGARMCYGMGKRGSFAPAVYDREEEPV